LLVITRQLDEVMILPVTRFRFRHSFICQGTSTRVHTSFSFVLETSPFENRLPVDVTSIAKFLSVSGPVVKELLNQIEHIKIFCPTTII